VSDGKLSPQWARLSAMIAWPARMPRRVIFRAALLLHSAFNWPRETTTMRRTEVVRPTTGLQLRRNDRANRFYGRF
jgi:hypothetical protein